MQWVVVGGEEQKIFLKEPKSPIRIKTELTGINTLSPLYQAGSSVLIAHLAEMERDLVKMMLPGISSSTNLVVISNCNGFAKVFKGGSMQCWEQRGQIDLLVKEKTHVHLSQ